MSAAVSVASVCGTSSSASARSRASGLSERAVDEHEVGARADGVVDRLREIPQAGGALAHAGGEVLLLHARGAVEQDEHRIRRAAGQAEPAAGQRPCRPRG